MMHMITQPSRRNMITPNANINDSSMKLNTKGLLTLVVAGAVALISSCKDDHDHDHGNHAKGEKHSSHEHDNDASDKHDDHDHDKDEHADCAVKIGPNNGRILKKSGAEFLISPKGLVKIFPQAEKGNSTITFLIGSETINLKQEGTYYVSSPIKDKLKGKATIKVKANGKSYTDKFDISLEVCGDCDNAEYKCTCHSH